MLRLRCAVITRYKEASLLKWFSSLRLSRPSRKEVSTQAMSRVVQGLNNLQLKMHTHLDVNSPLGVPAAEWMAKRRGSSTRLNEAAPKASPPARRIGHPDPYHSLS